MDNNDLTQQVAVAVPQITKNDFLGAIANSLTSYKWPQGSIESINPDDTKLVFLWGYRFKGKAEASWTAKVSGSQEITINNQKTSLADGTPYSGTVPSVDFDLLVINDNDDTPYWAKDFCKVGFEGENYQTQSYVSAAGGVVAGSTAGTPHSSWMKYGNEITDNFLLPVAEDLASNQAVAYMELNILPAEVIQQSMNLFKNGRFSCRDVSVSSRNSVTEDPTPVLIPFYLLEFQFEGKTHHLAMIADKTGLMKGKIPPERDDDNKTPEQIVEEEMPDKVKKAKLMKWGWILAVLLLFVAGFIVALIVLVAWYVGKWFMEKPIKDRIKELEKQDSDKTQKTAALLKKQLLR